MRTGMKTRTHITKTAITLFIATVVILLAFPAKAEAAGGIYLCGKDISTYNDNSWHSAGSPSISGWTAGRFKLSTDQKTLYLDGFNYRSPGASSCTIIEAGWNMTVHASGSNSFGNNDFISLYDSGSNSNYDLVLEGDSGSTITIEDPGIGTMMGVKNLTLSECEFVADAPVYIDGTMNINTGAFVVTRLQVDSLNITDGIVNVQTSTNEPAVTVNNELKMTGGTLYAFNNGEATLPQGMLVSGPVTIEDGILSCVGDLRISGSYTQAGGSVYASRYVSVIDSMNLSGGSLDCILGIYCYGAMIKSGNDTLKTGFLNVKGMFTGAGGKVETTGNITVYENMTISGASVKANGAFISKDLVVTAGTLECTSTVEDTALSIDGNTTLSGGMVRAICSRTDYPAVWSGGKMNIEGGSFNAINDKGPSTYLKGFSMSGGSFYGNSGGDGNSGLHCFGSLPDLSNDIWISAPDDAEIVNDDYLTYQVYGSDDQPAKTVRLGKVNSISVQTKPSAVSDLYTNDSFDMAGLVLNIVFEDGSTAALTYNEEHKDLFTFTRWTPNTQYTSGEKNVEITCFGKKTSFSFTVKDIGIPVLSGTATTNSANLSWTAADGAQKYIVFAEAAGSGISRRIGETTGRSYTVTGLTPGSSIEYTVYAARIGSTGYETMGEPSNVLTLTIGLDAPQLTVSPKGYDSASLRWTAVEGAASYEAYRRKSDSGAFVSIGTTENTALEDTGLDTGAEYTYYVVAKNGSVVSDESNHAAVMTVFTGSTKLTVSNNGAGYDLAWDSVDGATAYEVWRGNGAEGTRDLIAETEGLSFTDSSADSYSVYNYIVKPKRTVSGNAFYAADSNVVVSSAKDKPAPVIVPPTKDDPAGTAFNLLQARAGKITKTSVQIVWKKVPGAKKYVVYGNKCGSKNKYKKLSTTAKTTLTYKKVAGKKVSKGTYYKFIVYALDSKGKVISTSKTVHVATTGGKVGNDKKVTTAAKKGKVTIKKGKTFKLKAKAIPASKKLKVHRHRGMAYESSNKKIATVSSKGVIKGKSKGTCYVYAYTQNGVFTKVKVTVK